MIDHDRVTHNSSHRFGLETLLIPSFPIGAKYACYNFPMDIQPLPGAHATERVQTGAHAFGEWLTVSEAVTYCSLSGLERTPKTLRKWAHRSHLDPENADLTVRREDVDNGFRWTIEKSSLDRKIAQELEFEARRAGEPVSTGPDASGEVHAGAVAKSIDDSSENPSDQVQTGAHRSTPVRDPFAVIDELRNRIEDLKGEVEFYRDELRDRRQTTMALTDVIEAFRLTAQSNASRAGRETERNADQRRIFSEGDNDERTEHRDAV